MVFDCPSSAGSVRYGSCEHELVSPTAILVCGQAGCGARSKLGRGSQASRPRVEIGCRSCWQAHVVQCLRNSWISALQTADAAGDNERSRRFNRKMVRLTEGLTSLRIVSAG
jgi:hypothetical protein